MNLRLLLLYLINSFKMNRKQKPARLNKQQKSIFSKKQIMCLIIGIFLFALIFLIIFDGTSVVESGNYYHGNLIKSISFWRFVK